MSSEQHQVPHQEKAPRTTVRTAGRGSARGRGRGRLGDGRWRLGDGRGRDGRGWDGRRGSCGCFGLHCELQLEHHSFALCLAVLPSALMVSLLTFVVYSSSVSPQEGKLLHFLHLDPTRVVSYCRFLSVPAAALLPERHKLPHHCPHPVRPLLVAIVFEEQQQFAEVD